MGERNTHSFKDVFLEARCVAGPRGPLRWGRGTVRRFGVLPGGAHSLLSGKRAAQAAQCGLIGVSGKVWAK